MGSSPDLIHNTNMKMLSVSYNEKRRHIPVSKGKAKHVKPLGRHFQSYIFFSTSLEYKSLLSSCDCIRRALARTYEEKKDNLWSLSYQLHSNKKLTIISHRTFHEGHYYTQLNRFIVHLNVFFTNQHVAAGSACTADRNKSSSIRIKVFCYLYSTMHLVKSCFNLLLMDINYSR